MAKLSQSEIEGYAADAGFTGNDIHIAGAVAMAESGGSTTSHNATPPDNSYGLWQINMLGSLGPSRRKQFGITSNDQLYDPRINAQAAHAVWKGSGWSAWTTYTRGTYQKYMAGSSSASESSTSSGDGSSNTGITGAITNIGENIFKAASNLTGIIVAVVLLILGIVLLARNQVGKVVPAGKIGKVVKAVSK